VIGIAVAGNASATVNWTAPTGVVTGYEVEVQTAAGAVVGALRPAAAAATSLVVTGLTNGTSYRFRVRGVNEVGPGPFSVLSNAVTPATVPNAPTIGTPTAGNASATVRWTAPGNDGGSPLTGFTVQVINAAGAQIGALRDAGAAATSLVVTGLTNGTTYRFRVRAVNAVGASAPSANSIGVTPTAAGPPVGTVPGAPIIRNATSGVAGGAVTATAAWRAPQVAGSSPITGYRVTATRAGSPPVVSAVQAPQPVQDQSLTMTLPAGDYRFTVVAINAVGAGAPSAQSNLVTAR
jgi:predicted phage tail protein